MARDMAVRGELTMSGKTEFTHRIDPFPTCNDFLRRKGKTMTTVLNRLVHDQTGATAIEYGLIAALIAVASIVAMQGFGNEFRNTFNTASGAMAGGNSAA